MYMKNETTMTATNDLFLALEEALSNFDVDDEAIVSVVLDRIFPVFEKVQAGKDLSYSDENLLESSSTYVLTDMEDDELEAYTTLLEDAIYSVAHAHS
jgi:hypothetical protein